MDQEKFQRIQDKYMKLIESVERLEQKCAIFFHRNENRDKLQELEQQMSGCKELLLTFQNGRLAERVSTIRKEYERVKARLELQHHQMLYVLQAIEDAPAAVQPAPALPKPALPIPESALRTRNDPNPPQSAQCFDTPRMTISQYENSPFVGRKRPIQLHFLDFDVEITQQEFAKIPHYLKGRDTIDDLHSFLRQILIPTLTEKYALIHKKRDAIANPQDVEIWRMFRSQEDYFPNMNFVTEGDIARKIGRLVDKKMSSKIQMLRFLGILREVRKNKATCYVWVKGSS